MQNFNVGFTLIKSIVNFMIILHSGCVLRRPMTALHCPSPKNKFSYRPYSGKMAMYRGPLELVLVSLSLQDNHIKTEVLIIHRSSGTPR